MKWVPYPSKAYGDPRLAAAGEAAEILWSRAWAWCGDQETDGFIPAEMVARLCPTRTSQRLAALLALDIWVEVEGGYLPTDWREITDDIKGMEQVREQAAERARRYRANRKAKKSRSTTPATSPSRDESRDALRDESRPRHGQEVEGDNYPPDPPPSGGHCDPITKPHRNCRGCGTSRRGARRSPAEAAAAELRVVEDMRARRAAVQHCGACSPYDRTVEIPGMGVRRCPDCHPDLVVGPLPRYPQLVVVPRVSVR